MTTVFVEQPLALPESAKSMHQHVYKTLSHTPPPQALRRRLADTV